jgi:hypothetical protein
VSAAPSSDLFIFSLEQRSTENSMNTSTDSTFEEIDVMENIASDQNFPVLKKGVKLPKSNAEWSTADSYFKFELQLKVRFS